ncbi:MICOS complex subunit MIC10-like isoform X2 [Nilaparvata lugens]|uniref:MICOS complex subunit MIC10-like isoform X1 n=1 Tax=Nilaparvata lugens TaxID=108931 RepID=UPI00193E3D53|nr:MICOS complex subunit MIC10-like isoform X1 [Nilaparvata lugens]XP_039297005.1 MICOS complex subunit MIC10-like isoform X2 [Nilaparvata lugens]
MASQITFKEDELGKKWDMCIYNSIVKMGGGLAVGTIGSLLFFKRRAWPILLGSSFGLGVAYSNCEQDIKRTLSPKA